MIESVEIRNFKSIKQKHFPLRNLNVLMGMNGMGKSSFIQCLLAMRQSYDLTKGELRLGGEYVKIGTTKDALYQYAQDSPLEFVFKFSNYERVTWKFDYQIEADNFIAKAIKEQRDKHQFLQEIEREVPLFNSKFQYLHASRIDPSSITAKNYTSVVQKLNIGNSGEHVGHFIEVFGNGPISISELIHPKSTVKDDITGKDIVVDTLINQINLWMGEISPNVQVRTTEVSSEYILLEYVFKQRNLGNTNRFKPENVGFGISYSLPVVVSLLKAKPGDLLVIENPESHVHPRGQAEIGKMIAIAAMNGVQIVLETHSDHVINGIRVAVKDKKITKDKVIIFYFDKQFESSEQYSKITNIEIDPNGELSEYPKNMLDEWGNQLFKLM